MPSALATTDRSVLDRPLLRYIAMLLPVLLAAVAFFPITKNYFFADDFQHFYQLRNWPLLDFITTPQAGHLYMTRNTIWYVLDRLFRTESEPYFWFVLALHLVNVWLLSRVILRLTASLRLACLGATVWGIAPANEGALGWFCVFGHVLATTWLLVLLDGLGRRADGGATTRTGPIGTMLLLLAMSTSFGVGIGFAMAFPLAAWVMLPPSRDRNRLVLASSVVAALLPFLYIGFYRWHPSPFAGATRLSDLIAQAAIFRSNALTLFFHLIVSGVSDLLSGPAFRRNSYPSIAAYAIAAGFLVGVLAALRAGDVAIRRRLIACTILLLAGYGMIAAGRGQTVPGGTQALYAPRYHYAVPALIAAVFCLALAGLDRIRWLRLPPRAKDGLLVGLMVLMTTAHVLFVAPIDHRINARRETARVLTAIHRRIDKAPPQGDVYIRNDVFEPIGPIRIPWMFPGWAAAFVIFFPENVVDGRRVYFVDDRPGVRAQARDGARTADLFVTSDRAPAPTDDY
jgi:type II secretory pathway component PulM